MSWTIFYKDDVIQIRNEAQNIVKTMRGIIRLEVTNRFSTKCHYSSPCGYIFHGYGNTLFCAGPCNNYIAIFVMNFQEFCIDMAVNATTIRLELIQL